MNASLKDIIQVVKVKKATAEHLKTLKTNTGHISIFTAGKNILYTDKILEEYINEGEILAVSVGGCFNIKYHNGLYYTTNNIIFKAIKGYNLKYIYYYLQSQKDFIETLYYGWGCKKLNTQEFLNIKIKKITLQEQESVINILDKLTTHTTELKTELNLRKKQYTYYREKLLTFEDNKVEWKTLGEVSYWDKRFNGVDKELQPKVLKFKHVSAEVLKSLKNEHGGDIKLLSTGNFEGYTTATFAEEYINEGEVFTIPTGGSANIKYYNGKFVDSGNLLGTARDGVLTKYIYYFLLDKNKIIQDFFRGSGVKHPDMTEILKLQIPIPPLSVQKEIVEILDKLTTHTTELKTELNLRKKQYTYYREKLLSFEKKED